MNCLKKERDRIQFLSHRPGSTPQAFHNTAWRQPRSGAAPGNGKQKTNPEGVAQERFSGETDVEPLRGSSPHRPLTWGGAVAPLTPNCAVKRLRRRRVSASDLRLRINLSSAKQIGIHWLNFLLLCSTVVVVTAPLHAEDASNSSAQLSNAKTEGDTASPDTTGADSKKPRLRERLRNTKPDELPVPYKDIPSDYKRVIEDADVDIIYHDPQTSKHGTWGFTRFDFAVEFQFRFRFTRRRAGTRRRSFIEMTSFNADPKVRHTITLPKDYESHVLWLSRLTKHEFDHVAISADPRARLLMLHTMKSIPPIEHDFKGSVADVSKASSSLLEKTIQTRREAVLEVVRANNRRLDEISRHGRARMREREAFFEELYSKQNLADVKFPYLGDVLDLLDSPEYVDAPRYYRKEPNF